MDTRWIPVTERPIPTEGAFEVLYRDSPVLVIASPKKFFSTAVMAMLWPYGSSEIVHGDSIWCYTHWRPFKYEPREPKAPPKKVKKYVYAYMDSIGLWRLTPGMLSEEGARYLQLPHQRIDASEKELDE